MSEPMYLEHLIARAFGRASVLQPRRTSRFEPTQPFTGIGPGDALAREAERLAPEESPAAPDEPLSVVEETRESSLPGQRAAPGPQARSQGRMPPGPPRPRPAPARVGEVPETPTASPPPQIERREERSAPRPPTAQGAWPLADTPESDIASGHAVSPRRQSAERVAGEMSEPTAPALLRPRREEGEAFAMLPSSSPLGQSQQESPRSVADSPRPREGDDGGLPSITQRLDALAQMIETRPAPQPAPGQPGVERAQPVPVPLAPRPGPQRAGVVGPEAIVPAVRPASEPAGRLAEVTAPTPAPEPTIQITIGRIEVRATAAGPSSSPRKATAPRLSLDEYLRQREAQQGG